jgi:TRAP-type C4-dicarboxylate transport system permease large subunit
MLPFILVETVILFLLVYFPKLSLIPLGWLM